MSFIIFKPKGNTGHIVVIDPDDQTPEVAASAIATVIAGTRAIFVGGSTAIDGSPVHDTVVAIKEAIELVVGMHLKIQIRMKICGMFQSSFFQPVHGSFSSCRRNHIHVFDE